MLVNLIVCGLMYHTNLCAIKQAGVPAQPESVQVSPHHTKTGRPAIAKAQYPVRELRARRPAFAALLAARGFVERKPRRYHGCVCGRSMSDLQQ